MFDVIIVAAGKSLRAKTDKLSASHGESTVLGRTIEVFRNEDQIKNIILVTDIQGEFFGVKKVPGGKTRSDSVLCGLNEVESEFVLIHDGARPFLSKTLLHNVMSDALLYGSSVPFLPLTDTLKKRDGDKVITENREEYFSVQTPQCFPTAKIKEAYKKRKESDYLFDDSELFEKYVSPVRYTEGEAQNKKITSPFDVFGYNTRIGSGFDVHELKENGKPLVLGGVKIPFGKGLVAHSDGDVVLHAVMDALLSAANERDIGVLFPDTDPKYENADSGKLLQIVKDILDEKNVKINNVSVTIIAQKPKLKDFLPLMQRNIAKILQLRDENVNLTATTTENLGIIKDGNAIAVIALSSVM